MAKYKITKQQHIKRFNDEIDRMIASGIPEENLPSKISEREGKNLTRSETQQLEHALKSEDFSKPIYTSTVKGEDALSLTEGMLAVDKIRMTAQNRIQREKIERIKTLPSYLEQSEYARRSLASRGDLIELTEGSENLSPRDRAKRVRSHERFYERSGGENLKKMLASAIENQATLMDLSDYLKWINSIDPDVLEETYYSDVDFNVVEFYQSQYQDEFVTMLNIFKGKIQSTANKNKALYSKKQMKTTEDSGKFYGIRTKEGDFIGMAYKSKMNKSRTGYTNVGGKRKRVYYEEFT